MARTHTVQVEADGAVRLPPDIRKSLGVSAGSRMLLDLGDDGEVRLRLLAEDPELTEKDGILVVRGVALGDVEATEHTEREARLLELGGFYTP